MTGFTADLIWWGSPRLALIIIMGIRDKPCIVHYHDMTKGQMLKSIAECLANQLAIAW